MTELSRDTRRALLVQAPGFQGGHSTYGQAIATLLDIPFPITVPNLEQCAKKWGYTVEELWPWLIELRQGKPVEGEIVKMPGCAPPVIARGKQIADDANCWAKLEAAERRISKFQEAIIAFLPTNVSWENRNIDDDVELELHCTIGELRTLAGALVTGTATSREEAET